VLTAQHAVKQFMHPLLSLAASAVLAVTLLTMLVALRPQILGQRCIGMLTRFFPRKIQPHVEPSQAIS
jgi:hypothetical protein